MTRNQFIGFVIGLELFAFSPITDAAEYRFYHPDPLGSNVVVTDRSGNVVQRTVTTPYGETRSVVDGNGLSLDPDANSTRHLYTGQEQDPESGLHSFGARHYDPFVGKFLSADPELLNLGESFGQIPFMPGVFNGHSYAANRPTAFIDPTGEFIFAGTAALIGGISTGAISTTAIWATVAGLVGLNVAAYVVLNDVPDNSLDGGQTLPLKSAEDAIIRAEGGKTGSKPSDRVTVTRPNPADTPLGDVDDTGATIDQVDIAISDKATNQEIRGKINDLVEEATKDATTQGKPAGAVVVRPKGTRAKRDRIIKQAKEAAANRSERGKETLVGAPRGKDDTFTIVAPREFK